MDVRTKPCFGVAVAVGLALVAGGCGDDGGAPVEIRFDAVVGGETFACGQTYAGLGASEAAYTPSDLRFYIHDLVLVASDGELHGVKVPDDDTWVQDDVILLDFEDGSGACAGGTPETNTTVRGKAPHAQYVAVAFTLGVPFEKNHQAFDAAEPPLRVDDLWESRPRGYRFLVVEGETQLSDGTLPWPVHLTSTGCGEDVTQLTTCDEPNRSEIRVEGFEPGSDVVTFDLARLFQDVDLAANEANSPEGCTSLPTDDDCRPVFLDLGLSWGSEPSPGQTAFRAATR